MRTALRRPPSGGVVLGAIFLASSVAACNAIFGITGGVPGGPGGSTGAAGAHTGTTGTGGSHTGSGGSGGMHAGTGGMHAGTGGTGGAHTGTGGTGGAHTGTGGMHAGTGGTGGSTTGTGGSSAAGTGGNDGGADSGDASTSGTGGSSVSCDGGGTVESLMLAPNMEAQAGKQYSYVTPTAVAATTGGALLIAGSYLGNGVNFGLKQTLGEPDGATEGTLFVARLTPVGMGGAWDLVQDLPGTGDAQVTGMAITGGGEIVLTGYFNGSLSFGPSAMLTLNTPASWVTDHIYAGFIAKLNGNFQPVWARMISNGASALPTSLAVGAKGNIVVAGAAQQGATILLGGNGTNCMGVAPPPSWQGTGFPFVVKLLPDGTCYWTNAFAVDIGFYDVGTLTGPVALTLDTNASEDVYLAGGSRNVNNWGTTVDSADPQNDDGQFTSYVAKLDGSTGGHVWDESFGSSNSSEGQVASTIALDGCGNVFVAGSFTGNAQFDGLSASLLLNAGSTPTQNVFLAKLALTGQAATPLTSLWLKAYGDVGKQTVASLLLDGAGNVLLTGNAADGPGSTGLVFGSGQPLVNTSDNADAGTYVTDFFVALLDGQGGFVRGTRASCPATFGTSDPGIGYVQNLPGQPVALDTSGTSVNVYLTGQFGGPCSFGGGLTKLSPKGQTDLFLLGLQ